MSKTKENEKWMDEFMSHHDDAMESDSSASNDSQFSKLFEESQKDGELKEGEITEGTVVTITPDYVVVDFGYKCEGQVSLIEFKDATGEAKVKLGDRIPIFIEKLELENGFVLLSKDRAEIVKAWDEISEACEKDQIVEGTVILKVKGGFMVDIGVKAFLPFSQLEPGKSSRYFDDMIAKKLKFKIIKFNKKRGNIVLSRKAVISAEREMQRQETLSSLQEGMVVQGSVKNITDYGAFIDLGGMDGLLHLTDMSWGRIKHPQEVLKVGDEIAVKILKYDQEKERISLGLKQVQKNPWDDIDSRYTVGAIVKGKVVYLKDYGAFVELEDGIEGLIHVSEMSWTERVKHPSKVLKPGDEVECKILEIDPKNKRISLGIKQLSDNPWDALELKYPVGTIIEDASVKSVTDFGVFVDVGMGIDGLVHVSDITWAKKVTHPGEKYKKGETIRVVVLGIDKDNEKFSLGVKQLERDPWENIKSRYRPGQSIEGAVTKLTDFGAFVEIEEGVEGLIYVSELSADQRVAKPGDLLQVGQVVRAEIISIEPKERRIGLSIKQLSKSEERSNYETYMNDSNKKTSMGDLLGEKLRSAASKSENSDE